MPIAAERSSGASLVDLIDRILDKGLVINADITVSLAGVELIGIKIRAAVASFETAARFGLEFPSGTLTPSDAWKQAQVPKEGCPQCRKQVPTAELLNQGCPWCGWRSPQTQPIKPEDTRPMISATPAQPVWVHGSGAGFPQSSPPSGYSGVNRRPDGDAGPLRKVATP